MKRSFMLSIAAVAILSVLCSGALAGAVKNLSALSGQEEQHKWTDGNTYVVDADLEISERITVTGSVTLMLTDGFTLSADQGINVSGDNGLTITTPNAPGGTGRLIANGSGDNAAIGGGYGESGGKITINGGIVTASAAHNGAGIGSGGGFAVVRPSIMTGGTITITGGTVKASSVHGTGIGVGDPGTNFDPANDILCGTIMITGGIITAESTGSASRYDIGHHYDSSDQRRVRDSRYGTLSSDPGGSGWVIAAKRVALHMEGFNGVIFGNTNGYAASGGNGRVYGIASVSGDVAIPSGKTLEIPDGASLTIRNGATLDASDGTLDNKGTLVNDGELVLPASMTKEQIKSLNITGKGEIFKDGQIIHADGEKSYDEAIAEASKIFADEASAWTPDYGDWKIVVSMDSTIEIGGVSIDGESLTKDDDWSIKAASLGGISATAETERTVVIGAETLSSLASDTAAKEHAMRITMTDDGYALLTFWVAKAEPSEDDPSKDDPPGKDDDPTVPTRRGSSGACAAGFGLAAIAALAIIKRRSR